MKRKMKIILLIVLVLAGAAYGVYSYLQPIDVETKKAEVSTARLTFSETGVVKNYKYHDICPIVTGKVTEIMVKKDDAVKKGDVLAKIDSVSVLNQIKNLEQGVQALEAQRKTAKNSDFAAKEQLKQQRSALQSSLIRLASENKSIDFKNETNKLVINVSKSKYENALEDLKKMKVLFDEGVISESEYQTFSRSAEDYKASYDQAVLASKQPDISYEELKSEIETQIKHLDNILKTDNNSANDLYYNAQIASQRNSINNLKTSMNDYTLVSDYDGIVGEILLEDTHFATTGAPAFHIKTNDKTKVEVKVNTRDITSIKIGDKVILTLPQRDKDIKLNGVVSKIAEEATEEISSLGVKERNVLVTITPEENKVLKEGYEVDCDFILYEEGKAISVPNNALYTKDGKDQLLLLVNGVIVEKEVTLGEEINGYTIVKSGLKEGDIYLSDATDEKISVGKRAK